MENKSMENELGDLNKKQGIAEYLTRRITTSVY